MNDSFHTTNASGAGRARRFLLALQAGGLGVLRLFGRSGGMPFDLEVALQKRELEEKLLAAGYSRKLAMIAVAEAFSPTAKPEQGATPCLKKL